MSSSTILSSRDINAPSTSTSTTDANNKPKSMDYHRQVLQSRLEEDKSKSTYISPSDTILSPCTQKLSAFKEKRFLKAKPQSLFAKTSARSLQSQQQQQQQQGGSTAPATIEKEKEGSNPFGPDVEKS